MLAHRAVAAAMSVRILLFLAQIRLSVLPRQLNRLFQRSQLVCGDCGAPPGAVALHIVAVVALLFGISALCVSA